MEESVLQSAGLGAEDPALLPERTVCGLDVRSLYDVVSSLQTVIPDYVGKGGELSPNDVLGSFLNSL